MSHRFAAIALAGLAAFACQSSSPPAPAASSQAPTVNVTAADYSFTVPATIAAGVVRFNFQNDGAHSHNMIIWRLKAGRSVADVKAADPATPPPVILSTFVDSIPGGTVLTRAGQRRELIVSLNPGTYALNSSGQDDTGAMDRVKGMVAGFSVTSGAATGAARATAPAATFAGDGTLSLPSGVRAGRQSWAVTNNSSDIHELVIAPAANRDQLATWLSRHRGESPVDFSGGAFVGGGLTAWTVLDLRPGDYVAFDDFGGSSKQDQMTTFSVT